jgi:hypothetical protein
VPEASVFDAYRANKALEGQLRPGDSLQVVAVDDVTGDYWVVTGEEVIVLGDGEIRSRLDLDTLQGEVSQTAAGLEVRLRNAITGALSIAAFRRPNRVTERLSAELGSSGPAATDG